MKNNIEKSKIELLKDKPMHGQFFRDLERQCVDEKASMLWLHSSGLKRETKSMIFAAQDKALNTKYHQKNILKQTEDSIFRVCNQAEEHISHMVEGCITFAQIEYTNRHNKVASYVHWSMCKYLGVQVPHTY